ncbi:MAG: HAD-IIIA family hydrolase [Bacteroidetes bacterium]|nr:HAD-IIIA family hydrolase [Bacteroidota bacterium]
MNNSRTALPDIDKTWTLFLDRDGVINEDVVGDYVKRREEFIFREGTLSALQILKPLFARIIIVSNQRGVEKGLMTPNDLEDITAFMLSTIQQSGGNIDQVFYCTSIQNEDPNRKPNIGMALQAQSLFPEINFSKSIMVGNMPGDMLFGKGIGAFTVYLPTRPEEIPKENTVDAVYKDLLAFANDLIGKTE